MKRFFYRDEQEEYEKWKVAHIKKIEQEREVTHKNSSLASEKLLIEHLQQNNQNLDLKPQLASEIEDVNNILENSGGIYKNELRLKKEFFHHKLSLDNYNQVIATVEGKSKKSCRIRFALCLLYITGLRISSLLILKGSDIETLLEHSEVNILQTKNNSTFHCVRIGDLGLSLLKSRQSDFKSLMEGKHPNDYLFTAYDKRQDVIKAHKALSRVQLNIDVNSTLRNASGTIFNTDVRSHNFRVSYIQEMLANMVPIESVQKIIGHKDIQTTAHYHESIIDGNNAKQIIRNLEQTRKASTKSSGNAPQ